MLKAEVWKEIFSPTLWHKSCGFPSCFHNYLPAALHKQGLDCYFFFFDCWVQWSLWVPSTCTNVMWFQCDTHGVVLNTKLGSFPSWPCISGAIGLSFSPLSSSGVSSHLLSHPSPGKKWQFWEWKSYNFRNGKIQFQEWKNLHFREWKNPVFREWKTLLEKFSRPCRSWFPSC